jgi:prepilin-type N-terminal cleavage/methylation domain-containing protein
MMNRKRAVARGFSLIEMAVVLVIMGLLLGGLLMPLAARMDILHYNETRQKLALIKEAINGFVLAHGRFPCPAAPAIASSVAGAGTENCSLAAGVVPWATLTTPELDAWGGRFSYVVTASMQDEIPENTVTPPASCTTIPDAASFALCSAGSLTINSTAGGSVALQVPAVIISHGKNGFGAYRDDGSQLSSAGAAPGELQNTDGTSPFVHGEAVQNGYDDFVEWISLNVLFNRMVSAGRLP